VTGSSGHVRVEVLHQFRLTVEGEVVPLSDGSERLVGCLAVADRPHVRSSLAGALWPDRTEQVAQASLRRALWRLNRDVPGLLEQGPTYVGLCHHVEVDLREVYAVAESPPAEDGPCDRGVIRMLEGYGDQLALVDVAGEQRKVNVGMLPEETFEAGDWVIIHMGFVVEKTDKAGADAAMEGLELMGRGRETETSP